MDTIAARRPQTATNFPLPAADLESLGFRRQQIDRLVALIERHIAEGRYPGCQIALARHGKLAGEWRDCVIVEKLLGEAAGASGSTPSPPPRPPAAPR